ncbi:MAG: hypothetical protein ACR2HH_14800 [Chthoniobacterales bacterium]
MTIKIASCLLTLSLLGACQTTQPTASRTTLQQRMLAQNTASPNAIQEPAPPAEGPGDVPAEGPIDPNRNPGLLPTPLLRGNAASGL